MSPKPIVTRETSQYDEKHNPHRYGAKPGANIPIRTYVIGLALSAVIILVGFAILWSVPGYAREGSVRPILAPPALVKARAACPFDHPLKCRAALVHAYQAIAWAKQLRTHVASPARVEHLREFTCIHQREGAWDANTGNGYFGGLQMDRDFMTTYGADMIAKYGGWANLWSPRDQIIVANRAHHTRGFHPWPNTARACGLLR